MESSKKNIGDLNYSEEDLIDVLLKQVNDSREDFCIFAIRELKHYQSAKIIEKLATIILTDKKNEKKLEAIRSLKSRKPNEYIKKIIVDQLKSRSEDIRSEAAEFLKEYGDVVEKDIRKFLLKDLPSYSKEKAIWLLGQIGEKETITFLEEYKKQNKNEFDELIVDSIGAIKTRNVRLLLDDLKKKC